VGLLLFCCLQFVASEMYTIEQTIVGSGNCTNLNLQTAAILAAVLPFFGVDRFYLGYIVLGILKLFVFWTLAALTSAGIVFSIFTIRSIRKAEAKKRKATSDKRSKEDKPKKEKKTKKSKKEKIEVTEDNDEKPKEEKPEGEEKPVVPEGEEKPVVPEGEEKKDDETKDDKGESKDDKKEKDEEAVDEDSEAEDDSDADPETDDETAEASLNRRKKQLIRVNVVIWVGIVIFAVCVFGWFITDFVLILTNIIQPLHCFWPVN
jgi:uncharacterized membrane protein